MNLHVGLCNSHEMFTNDGDKIILFIFPAKVENDLEYIEEKCREYIQKFMDIMRGIPHKKRAADRGSRSTFNLYTTGHSPSLVSFLKCWVEQQERLEMCYADLVIQYWNPIIEEYYSQPWAMIT